MRLPSQIMHLIIDPNADQYATEMGGLITGAGLFAALNDLLAGR